jgi:hypothetical protein
MNRQEVLWSACDGLNKAAQRKRDYGAAVRVNVSVRNEMKSYCFFARVSKTSHSGPGNVCAEIRETNYALACGNVHITRPAPPKDVQLNTLLLQSLCPSVEDLSKFASYTLLNIKYFCLFRYSDQQIWTKKTKSRGLSPRPNYTDRL